MTSLINLSEIVDVVIGVDTHVGSHSAALVHATTGAVLDEITVEASPVGYAQLVEFAEDHADQHGAVRAWAIEGTGSHGAGLARHLQHHDEIVFEVDRPARARRRHGAKSDPIDAIRAAREALACPRSGAPRTTGERQALAVLLAARRSAVNGAGIAQRQIFGLVIAAPEPVRAKLGGLKLPAMVKAAAGMRIHSSWDLETKTTMTTLRALARRVQALTTEAAEHQKALKTIVTGWRPDLLEEHGVGPTVAATVLCAWSHPGRIHSESAFAMLAGVEPIPANSGQITNRYRLNRSGDRQLNRAIHTIVLSRQRHDQTTRDYIERRITEGKTPREARRCLKRYVARDLYRLLENPRTTP